MTSRSRQAAYSVNWCSVHYVNRTSFAFAGMTPAMAKAMRPSQMLYIQVV
ncbi:hypothetical protein AC46_5122 [Escherichia coli 2-222-05_S3_C3]|nr:hypothetical protein AC46_5122 [Escherichia coli 2-222-05_S3_C3]